MAISTLAAALEEKGHRIEVLRPSRLGPLPFPRRLLFNLTLDGRLPDPPADLVVGFDLDGAFLPRSRPFPLVVQLKGVAADEACFERGWGKLGRRAAASLERRNARRGDRVVVPSAYSRARAVAHYGLEPEQVAVVPEGIDLTPWEEVPGPGPDRNEGPATILSVARQYRRKNTRALLEALPRVARTVPEVRLRVVGDGPRLPALRRRARRLGIASRVEFLGEVASDRAVRRAYFDADCFCLPSLQEGFGIVFLEAMAAGLPIVAGRAGAAPEVVADREVGLLVDPRDPDAIAGALVELLTDRARARALGEAGRARVRRYEAGWVADRFLAAVDDLIDRSAGPTSTLRRPTRGARPGPTPEREKEGTERRGTASPGRRA